MLNLWISHPAQLRWSAHFLWTISHLLALLSVSFLASKVASPSEQTLRMCMSC